MRLFVSLRPPAEALDHLRAQRPQWPGDPGRWHVTLAFLGDAAEPEPVHRALSAALAGRPSFALALAGSGAFGRGPTWVGVAGDLAALHDLATAVREVLGVPPGAYRPHLTVGRRVPPAALAGYRGPAWPVREVELVRSELGRQVRHTVLRTYPLEQLA